MPDTCRRGLARSRLNSRPRTFAGTERQRKIASVLMARLNLIQHGAERAHAHGNVACCRALSTAFRNCSKANRQVCSSVRSDAAANTLSRRCSTGSTGTTRILSPNRDAVRDAIVFFLCMQVDQIKSDERTPSGTGNRLGSQTAYLQAPARRA